ncbi:hypothetical protein BHM03_00062091 [Ensete ventricosum]|nr:hypothetical protein BHM03_00062091 [Ensete ventricosum]
MAPSVRGGGGSVAAGDVGGGAGEGGGYYPAPPPLRFSSHHLEVTVISAQDLYPATRSMRTYAVAYFRPDHRARTRIDASGHIDPTWNDKFLFRVDDAVLRSDTSAITIDVYAARPGLLPGPDILLGTARALLSTLRPSSGTHYAALQIRRPTSLRPQGILNLGVALLDPSARSVPVHADHRHASSNPRPEVPKPKRPTAGTSRAADRERTELERKLEKWRAELPPISGEVVRLEKGGRNRGAPVAAVVEDEPVIRWQRIRSFKRFACFGGGNVESGEFVAAPRYVEERPPRRPARDAVRIASLRPRLAGSHNVPARDRIIEFGKHKGRMLGSLPSSYLRWVSRNLRARDFEDWARLADEVLQDPVYRDRLEWEAAERVLTGDARRRSSFDPADSPVGELIEVSDRFGWDNEAKEAWAGINFELLGTSKGGRIPRVRSPSPATEGGHGEGKHVTFRRESKISSGSRPGPENKSEGVDMGSIFGGMRLKRDGKAIVPACDSIASSKEQPGALATDSTLMEQIKDGFLRGDPKGPLHGSTSSGRRLGTLSKGHRFVIGGGGGGEEEEDDEEGKEEVAKRGNREERRERMRLKREQQLVMLRREVGVEERNGRGNEASVNKRGVLSGGEQQQIANPFPGRRALLEKVKRQGD